MVTAIGPKWRDRQGKIRLGCLFTLLVAAAAAYYGVGVGGVYVKQWQFKEEMKAQAGYAPSIDDEAIRRRLARKIEELGLPNRALRQLRVRRTMTPREIVISTTYEVTLTLPFRTITVTLRPEVRSPL